MGGGFSRNKKRESVLDEVDWYIGSKGLPQPPKAPPPAQHLANALLRSDSVNMQDESGDEITLLNCRPKFLEVMSGGKWQYAVSGIIASTVSREGNDSAGSTVTLHSLKDKPICRARATGVDLLNLLSDVAHLADIAGIPHTLSAFVVTTDPHVHDGTAEGSSCADCGLPLIATPLFCVHTGRPHRGPRWSDASGLPSGSEQGQPSPRASIRPDRSAVIAAMDRGEVVTFQTPSGRTKLVLHHGGRLDVYAPTGDWMYSAQRISCHAERGRLQMMCYETGLFKKPILGVPFKSLQMVATLADRAAVVHNIWDQLGVEIGQLRGRKASRIVSFICPACTYANTSGGVCRMCGAAKPDEQIALPGQVEGDQLTDECDAEEGEEAEEGNSDTGGGGGAVSSPRSSARSVPRSVPRSGSLSPRKVLRVETCEYCGLSLAEVPLTCLVSGRKHPRTELRRISTSPSLSPRGSVLSTGSPRSLSAERTCPVCSSATANTVLMPCKHVASCAGCAVGLDECPICSTAVSHRLEIWR